jgi:hypothetical protein
VKMAFVPRWLLGSMSSVSKKYAGGGEDGILALTLRAGGSISLVCNSRTGQTYKCLEC